MSTPSGSPVPRPHLQALLICRGGSADEASGEISLSGIMYAVPLATPPPNTVRWGQVYIYGNIANAESGIRVELTVVGVDGPTVFSVFKGTPARHPDPRMPMQFVVETKIPMQRLGRYELRCFINDEPAGQTTFFVFDPATED